MTFKTMNKEQVWVYTYCYSDRVKKRRFEERHFTARAWIGRNCWIQEIPCIVSIVTNDIPICEKKEFP